jgi:hypothetical protein
MRFKLFLVLVLVPGLLKAQFAVFTTDTMFHSEQDQLNSEWVIAGQHLTYGSPPIRVKTDDLLDTMYFRTDAKRNWDTIICQISQAQTYKFVYNDCCGGFYIADSNGHFFNPRMIFTVKNARKKDRFIGKLGDDGVLIEAGENRSDTLQITCHSVLLPNIFNLSFQKITPSSDTTLALENACVKNKVDINYEYTYIIEKLYPQFLYMPLSNDCMSITIDTKKKRFYFK